MQILHKNSFRGQLSKWNIANLYEEPRRSQRNETEVAVKPIMISIEYKMIQVEEPAKYTEGSFETQQFCRHYYRTGLKT